MPEIPSRDSKSERKKQIEDRMIHLNDVLRSDIIVYLKFIFNI